MKRKQDITPELLMKRSRKAYRKYPRTSIDNLFLQAEYRGLPKKKEAGVPYPVKEERWSANTDELPDTAPLQA